MMSSAWGVANKLVGRWNLGDSQREKISWKSCSVRAKPRPMSHSVLGVDGGVNGWKTNGVRGASVLWVREDEAVELVVDEDDDDDEDDDEDDEWKRGVGRQLGDGASWKNLGVGVFGLGVKIETSGG